jgi:AAA family ATP:ADP antiporter
MGPMRLIAGVGAALLVCVVLARLADRYARSTSVSSTTAAAADAPVGDGQSGFAMILSDRYLMLIATLVLLLNVVNTTGEYLFGRYVVQNAAAMFGAGPASEAARQQFIGESYSSLFSAVNLIGLLLQMFVVSRLFAYLGVGRSLFVHPIVAAAGYLLMLGVPSFNAMKVVKTLDNSLDYSLGNTTKQALWLPTSRQAKYKAKQAVDSFCVRAGDVVSAGFVYAGDVATFTIPVFAALNVALSAAWLFVVSRLNRRLVEQSAERDAPR